MRTTPVRRRGLTPGAERVAGGLAPSTASTRVGPGFVRSSFGLRAPGAYLRSEVDRVRRRSLRAVTARRRDCRISLAKSVVQLGGVGDADDRALGRLQPSDRLAPRLIASSMQ